MIRKQLSVGLEVAYSTDERRETIATPTLQKATVLHIGPIPRRVTIYEHPFSKVVKDGVLIRIGSRDLVCSPRDILGTWDEHVVARRKGDEMAAKQQKRERAEKNRRDGNITILENIVTQDPNYDFSLMKSWLKNPTGVPISAEDVYRLVDAIFQLKMFMYPEREEEAS